MIDFDETGLYKGFVKNAKGQKYQSGRNPKIMPLEEANQYEGFSGVMNANTVLLDADEQPYSDILQNIIKGEKLGAYVTDRQGGRGIHVLMINGTERKAIYSGQPYQKIPKYFTPLPKCTIDFTNLGEGDGRNSTLFSYILTLQNAGLDKEDIRETIRIINQYVMAEPIEQSELDVILRDGLLIAAYRSHGSFEQSGDYRSMMSQG